MTHEHDLGKNLSFLCAQNCLILLCIFHRAALWPVRSSCTLSFLRRVLFLEKCSFFEPTFSVLSFSRSPLLRLPTITPLPSFFFTSVLFSRPLRLLSLSIYFSLFGAVDRVTSNVNQSAGIVASFLRQWFSISVSERCVKSAFL